MDTITSRKNAYISHLRALASDEDYRLLHGEFVCDGIKMLREAQQAGMEISSVLWRGKAAERDESISAVQYAAPEDLFDYASSMKNSPGPLFTVKIKAEKDEGKIKRAILLENVQDPGNVGTVIRTANALGIDAVILTGACAKLHNPKTVRATMGAIFRQRVVAVELAELTEFVKKYDLKLYGAALSDNAKDIRALELDSAIVAIGSEGQGLSPEFLNLCEEKLIIPMQPDSESLNAAVAASIVMWEMAR